MREKWKTAVSVLFYTLGILGWCYVGGWLTLTRPVRGILMAHLAGSLSVGQLCMAVLQGFCYLSLAGGVWCIGYMLGNYFKEH